MRCEFVLLRGLGRQSKHWGAFIPALQASFPEARIHTPDLPGSGCQRREKTPIRLEGFIPFLEKQLDLEPTSRKILLGISLGGTAALCWQAQQPRLFEATFVINSSAAPFATAKQRLLPKARYLLIKAALSPNAARREATLLDLVSNCETHRSEALGFWVDLQKNEGMRFVNIIRQLRAAATYQYKPLATPHNLHILASKGDRLCDVACSVKLAEATQATLDLHPSAGHDLTLDEPRWVIERLKAYIRPQR